MIRLGPALLLLALAAAPAAAQRTLAIERFDATHRRRPPTGASTSPRRSRRGSPAPGTGSTAPSRWSTARRRASTGRCGSICWAPPTRTARPLEVESEPRAPLHQVQDLGARRRGRDPHRGAPLPGDERAPLLRGPRRAVLERHRRRVGRADRGGHRPDRAAGRRRPASARSPSTAPTAPPRATPTSTPRARRSASRMPQPLGVPRGAHGRGRAGTRDWSPSRPRPTGRWASWRATGRSRSRSRCCSGCSLSGAGWAAIPGGCRSRCSTSRRTRSPRPRPAR